MQDESHVSDAEAERLADFPITHVGLEFETKDLALIVAQGFDLLAHLVKVGLDLLLVLLLEDRSPWIGGPALDGRHLIRIQNNHAFVLLEDVEAAVPAHREKPGLELGFDGSGILLVEFEKNVLDSYRQRVDSAGDNLQALLDSLEKKGFRLGEIELKRVPKPYTQDHECAELLRRKGLSAWYDFADAELACQTSLVENCISQFAQTKPLFDWLRALEPSGGG